MEMLIAVAIVTAVIGRGAGLVTSDLQYAAKGKDHPRWAYKQAKLEAARRGEPTGYWSLLAARAWRKTFDKHAEAAAKQSHRPAVERGPRPLRNYMGRCWADAWKTAEAKHDKRVTERRRRRNETTDQDAQPGPVAAPTDADLTPSTAGPSEDGVDDAFDSAPRDEPTKSGEHEPTTAPVDQSPAASSARGMPPHPSVVTPEDLYEIKRSRERVAGYLAGDLDAIDRKPDWEDTYTLIYSSPYQEDRDLARRLIDARPDLTVNLPMAKAWEEEQRRAQEAETQAARSTDRTWTPYGSPTDAEGMASPATVGTDQDKEDQTRTDPSATDDGSTVHDNVIPFNKPLPRPKGITEMSNLNTEIDGLESAITWAEDVRNNAAEMASGIDEVESDFATRGVKGETLTLVGQVGEAYEELRDLAASLAAKLNAMTSVTEAYEASPDAGDKEFVTS